MINLLVLGIILVLSIFSESKSIPDDNVFPDTKVCGQLSEGRIFGGNETGLEEFPWIALLQYESSPRSTKTKLCHGDLITKRYVLTAGHCVYNEKLENVVLGEHNIETKVDCQDGKCAPAPVTVAVDKVIIHEDFDYRLNPFKLENDIALIKLKENVLFTKFIQPVCMPTKDLESTYSKGQLSVAGWGKTETGSYSPVKLRADFPLRNLTECRNSFKTNVERGFICAGKLKHDACSGDSGAPLMKPIETNGNINWYQIGIVSYGREMCGNKDPGVYTNVVNYIDWIKEKLKD